MANLPMNSHLGFYLHTSWEYNYPFAVRKWRNPDFRAFFGLLEDLGFDLVMFWPLTETMPAPLSQADRAELEIMRGYVDEAHARHLDFWAVFCPNTTVYREAAEVPFPDRQFYPFKREMRLDNPEEREAYFAHRAEIFKVLNNADGYVTIDGDPGGYPGAQPEALVEVFLRDRAVINEFGTYGTEQKLVPWLWAGWGADWASNGPWREPIEPLTRPVLELLKERRLDLEPMEYLPGRSITDDWGNGRVNFQVVEDAGVTSQSMLLLYEIIEFEPAPPAPVIQFQDIRRVLRQEAPLIARARGIVGNAQQPVMALPNLWLVARGARADSYLDVSDAQVLIDFAEFLGGDPDLLAPAWSCLSLELSSLPPDLPARLRRSKLTSDRAQGIPGGPSHYLEILAAVCEARIRTLLCAEKAEASPVESLTEGISALKSWWNVHRYTGTGEQGTGFRFEFTHPWLRAPVDAILTNFPDAKSGAFAQLEREGVLSATEAECGGTWTSGR